MPSRHHRYQGDHVEQQDAQELRHRQRFGCGRHRLGGSGNGPASGSPHPAWPWIRVRAGPVVGPPDMHRVCLAQACRRQVAAHARTVLAGLPGWGCWLVVRAWRGPGGESFSRRGDLMPARTCSRYCLCSPRPDSYSELVIAATSAAVRAPKRPARAAGPLADRRGDTRSYGLDGVV